jgi:hypothetical protein
VNEGILKRIKETAILEERKRIVDILEQFKNNDGFYQKLKPNEGMSAYWLSDSTMKQISGG